MVYHVYGAYYSSATQRVLLVLEELGAEYEMKAIDMQTNEHKSPDYLTHQPWGQVPYLSNGEYEICESRAIGRYLLDKAGDKGAQYLGTTPEERGQVNQWIDTELSHYNEIVSGLVWELIIKSMLGIGEADAEAVKSLLVKANVVLDIYDSHLSKQSYLAGSHVTLADLVHIPETAGALSVQPDLFAGHKHVQAWWERITSREAWKKVAALSA